VRQQRARTRPDAFAAGATPRKLAALAMAEAVGSARSDAQPRTMVSLRDLLHSAVTPRAAPATTFSDASPRGFRAAGGGAVRSPPRDRSASRSDADEDRVTVGARWQAAAAAPRRRSSSSHGRALPLASPPHHQPAGGGLSLVGAAPPHLRGLLAAQQVQAAHAEAAAVAAVKHAQFEGQVLLELCAASAAARVHRT